MKIQAVLFDIDGTLVDSNEQHVNAWAFAFRDEGHPQERDDIRAQIGKGADMLLPALIPDVAEGVRQRIADRHGDYFADMYLDHVRAFPRAAELVAKVHDSGRKVVLASSAGRAEVEHYVDLLGIADRLSTSTSIDDVESSKPAPDIFSAALHKAGVAAEHALVVGDTPYDVAAAQRAGLLAVGVTSGPFGQAELRDAGAIAVYADVADLLDRFDASPLAG